MTTTAPLATFRLLKDFRPKGEPSPQLSDLRAQLAAVPDLGGVVLSPAGESVVVVSLPAANQRQKNKLRAVLASSLHGWKIIDDVSYRLPETF